MAGAVLVDGVEIAPRTIAAEMQYHPAPTGLEAWHQAASALIVRHLLLREAGLAADASEPAGADEEGAIQALLERTLDIPPVDEQQCRERWAAAPERYRAPALYEAAHILFPAAADDPQAREAARSAAEETLAILAGQPERFAALARERSACPSAAEGGRLGQLCQGDLVPEIETYAMALEDGQICPVPIATRYGYHLLRLDRRADGALLPFESVAPGIARTLEAEAWQDAVRRYIGSLIAKADIQGIDLVAA